MPQKIKPPRLKPGQTIGLIAPASNTWENDDIQWAMENLASLGFKLKPAKNLFQRSGYFAGSARERADDLHQMFADPEVNAIFALRGGFGSAQLFPLLDYELIRRNPKIIMGYSDISGLLNAIHLRTGLVTFHGPIAKQTFPKYTLEEMRRVLQDPQKETLFALPPVEKPVPGQVERENRLVTIVGGKATGELVGGNLSVISRMLGTPFQPQFKDKLLFLEDVNEEPYRIDSLLTHLWLAGVFEQVRGVVFGKFMKAEPTNWSSFSIDEVLHARFEVLKKPVIRGAMLGHLDQQSVFPIGIQAVLDADKRTLKLTETAVT